MTNVLSNSYRSLSFLFMLNRDLFLSFGMTALALAAGAYLITL